MYQDLIPTLEIKLNNIRNNYTLLSAKLGSSVVCAPAVKADAYGLGMEHVVPVLVAEGCSEFYVAYAEEGLQLRSLLPDATIYALHGVFGSTAGEVIEASLIPVLNTQEDIHFWAEEAKRRNVKLPVVVHVDTGMNRLGLPLEQFTSEIAGLDIRYVMSHLACADDASHPKNAEQLQKFTEVTQGLEVKKSFANSGGVFLGKEYHFDQVRPGAAIYGINPTVGKTNPMQGVVELKAPVLQVRDAKKGETVGYGANYLLQTPTKLATISVGYADGFLRSLTGRGHVYIAGQKCAIAGRVSMDTVVVDVSHLKVEPKVGDWAEILGEHQTVDDLALVAGTIGYEILTSLGNRYKRVYTGS